MEEGVEVRRRGVVQEKNRLESVVGKVMGAVVVVAGG